MAILPRNVSERITGHANLREALRDTNKYSSDLQGDADVRDYRQIPLEVDPPKHHLYRAALAPYFVKPHIEKYSDSFRLNSESQFQKYFTSTDSNFVSNFALPYVMTNLGLLFNRPQDVAEWISWGPDVWTAQSDERDGKVLHEYINRIYSEALTSNLQDMWQEITNLEISGERITELEFKGIVGVLLAGGRDTVIKVITGITWYLSHHPEILVQLRENRSHLQPAISEFLRYFTPLPAMARTKVAENGINNLPDDRYVEISFISGNFDATVFENPFEIHLGRQRNAHLSFGFGPHTCIGLHLAEFEIRIFLETLLDSEISLNPISEKITYFGDEYPGVPENFLEFIVQAGPKHK